MDFICDRILYRPGNSNIVSKWNLLPMLIVSTKITTKIHEYNGSYAGAQFVSK